MPILRSLGLLLWLGLAGCSSLQLAWDYDAQAAFPVLHSYEWLPAPEVESGGPQIYYNGLLDSRVRAAVDAQLQKKGFRRDTGTPDFLVAYHVALDERLSVTYLNELYGYGPGWGNARYRRSYGRPGREATVNEYRVGTLILDVVLAQDRRLIWRGSASDEVYPDLSAEAREKRINTAVERILAPFPP
jgi:hypothetical protein